jgi:hypothetical protein
MDYSENYHPTKKDIERLRKYMQAQPPQKQYPEITEFLERKRAEEKRQEGLSLLIG